MCAVEQLISIRSCQVFLNRSCSFWADTIKFTIKSSVHSKWSVQRTLSLSLCSHPWPLTCLFNMHTEDENDESREKRRAQYDSSSHMHQSHKLDDCCRMCNGKLQLSYWCRNDSVVMISSSINWLPMRCFIHYKSTEIIAITDHHYYCFFPLNDHQILISNRHLLKGIKWNAV